MSFTLFLILLIVLPIVLMGGMAAMFKKKMPENDKIPGIISLIIVAAAIFLGVWAPRVYVVYEENDEVTYKTQVVFFSYTYETEDGDEIEIEPVPFGCGVLNLLEDNMFLYPECYGDCSGDYGHEYDIESMSYEPTEEWNVDIFPGEEIPSSVSTKASSEIKYVLYVY